MRLNELTEARAQEWSDEAIDMRIELDWTDPHREVMTMIIRVKGDEKRVILKNASNIVHSLSDVMFHTPGIGHEAQSKLLSTAISKKIQTTKNLKGMARAQAIVNSVEDVTGLKWELDPETTHVNDQIDEAKNMRKKKKKKKAKVVRGYGGLGDSWSNYGGFSDGGDGGGGGE